ncbi:MAG: GNAT family N-acetyltransferase [Flavicella sp.]
MPKTEIKSIAAKGTLNIRQQVMWPDRDISYVRLPEDSKGLHYGLFLDGVLISVVSLFKNKDGWQFRKFATLQDQQGKGYGSKLLHYVLAIAEREKATKIYCNARVEKINFYTSFGLVPTKKTFAKGGISYVVMEKITCNN